MIKYSIYNNLHIINIFYLGVKNRIFILYIYLTFFFLFYKIFIYTLLFYYV